MLLPESCQATVLFLLLLPASSAPSLLVVKDIVSEVVLSRSHEPLVQLGAFHLTLRGERRRKEGGGRGDSGEETVGRRGEGRPQTMTPPEEVEAN